MRRAFSIIAIVLVALVHAVALAAAAAAEPSARVRVACIGDSTTQGAGVTNRATESYPARLQALLGDGYVVENLGVGGCTLIRKGSPNVWGTLRRLQAAKPGPDLVVVSLGINDTCGGSRRCWDHKDDFPGDYRDLIAALHALPSEPRVWICAPTPMVVETPGLQPERVKDLKIRTAWLAELIVAIKAMAAEKRTGFIDLNAPLAGHPQYFKDGVHMNADGYDAMAKLVHDALAGKKEAP